MVTKVEQWDSLLSGFLSAKGNVVKIPQLHMMHLKGVKSWRVYSLGFVCGDAKESIDARELHPQRFLFC